jgi:hypothetical protein
MSATVEQASSYIRRETRVAMAINALLSLLFYAVAFGRKDPVPVWGAGNWVLDFLPQGFMVAFMSTLVPGFLARKKQMAGMVETVHRRSALPRNIFARALLLAVSSGVLGTAAIAIVLSVTGVSSLSLPIAMALKLAYGAFLAALVTPAGLRAALAPAAAV